jgi:hypothetical protein
VLIKSALIADVVFIAKTVAFTSPKRGFVIGLYANNFDVGVLFMFNVPLGNVHSQPAGRVHQNKADV